MADNVTQGKLNQIKGKAREESGKVTGNKSEQIKGKAEQAAGKLREQFGKAKRNIKKAIGDQSDSIYCIGYLFGENIKVTLVPYLSNKNEAVSNHPSLNLEQLTPAQIKLERQQ